MIKQQQQTKYFKTIQKEYMHSFVIKEDLYYSKSNDSNKIASYSKFISGHKNYIFPIIRCKEECSLCNELFITISRVRRVPQPDIFEGFNLLCFYAMITRFSTISIIKLCGKTQHLNEILVYDIIRIIRKHISESKCINIDRISYFSKDIVNYADNKFNIYMLVKYYLIKAVFPTEIINIVLKIVISDYFIISDYKLKLYINCIN